VFQLDVRRTGEGGLRERILALVAEAARPLARDPVVHLDGPIDTVTSDAIASNLLAVLREALANVARHAQAASVDVRISATSDRVTLEVGDDGVGMAERARSGNGLVNIARRAEELGGTSDIGPNGDHGTCLVWSVPLGL
jgi:signal transduction histidine kinase